MREHLKEHCLHCDLGPSDRLLFQTSTAWMMWNWQLSALATGAAIILYDGLVIGPETLSDIVAGRRVTQSDTGPAYFALCQELGCAPGKAIDFAPCAA